MTFKDKYEMALYNTENKLVDAVINELPITELEMVKEFHLAFGHPTSEKPCLVSMELAKQRAEYMLEEIEEYLHAVKEGNLTKIADALGDLKYFVLGTEIVHGLDNCAYTIFDIIHNANMSKLCFSEEIANQTHAAYTNGEHPDKKGEKIHCYIKNVVINDKVLYAVLRKDNNKVLKSIAFKSPDNDIANFLKFNYDIE